MDGAKGLKHGSNLPGERNLSASQGNMGTCNIGDIGDIGVIPRPDTHKGHSSPEAGHTYQFSHKLNCRQRSLRGFQNAFVCAGGSIDQ
eukprot:6207731-Pleurochrysis_carterae.AAC.2